MAISGIEALRQLGLLGKANFYAAKSLTAWEYLQQVKATANDSQECCCFLGFNRILTWLTANPPGFRPQNTPTWWV